MADSSLNLGANAIVLRGVDVSLLGKLLQQQKQEGRAMVELIASAPVAQPRGADEPGKGGAVDLVA